MEQTSRHQAGNIMLSAVLIMLVIGAFVLVGIGVNRRHKQKTTASTVASTTASTTTTSPPSSSTASTDNQSLNSDLNSVNGSLTQNGQNLNSSNTAVNDQQQQVTVPTE